MSDRKTIVGLGELLWDMLPAGPQLGGAVSNFAVMAARLGNNGAIATRIGTDPLGREAMALLKTTPRGHRLYPGRFQPCHRNRDGDS